MNGGFGSQLASGQASRVVGAEEGRGRTLYCGSASLQPADGLLGAHWLDPRELRAAEVTFYFYTKGYP